MTETENMRDRRNMQPIQKLVDEYHPDYPAIQPAEIVKPREGKHPYLEAQDRRIREILTRNPKANIPHYPCG